MTATETGDAVGEYRAISESDVAFLWQPKAVDDVRTYFETFTGRRFDRLAGGGAHSDVVNSFTASDLVAVSMLSVNISGHASIDILETNADALSAKLSGIPAHLDLWDASDADIGPGSPADELWHQLNGINDVGWVTAGKLLARKRPRLLPVYDSVVRDTLGRKQDEEFWRPLRDLLSDSDPGSVRSRLVEVRDGSGIGDDITLLRVFDVATWMHGQLARSDA